MLTLTKKQYEVDEPVLINDENGKELYKFNIQLTMDELTEVKKIIFDENMEKDVRTLSKLEEDGKYDELTNLEDKINKKSYETLEKFEKMVYKEHLEPFKEKAGKNYYDKMTEQVYLFFVKLFVDQRANQVNTVNTSLRKIGRN